MNTSYEHAIKVSFNDLDAAGVVHFSRYALWMEAAEHALLENRGIPILQRTPEGLYGWPRIAIDIQFKHFLEMGDLLKIHLKVQVIGEKALKYNCDFLKILPTEPRLIATGTMTTLYTYKPLAADQAPYAILIPKAYLDQLS
jgi:acyl-CoA thioesterase FadM